MSRGRTVSASSHRWCYTETSHGSCIAAIPIRECRSSILSAFGRPEDSINDQLPFSCDESVKQPSARRPLKALEEDEEEIQQATVSPA